MTELLQEIKSRGYWRVRIRPADYRADRIPNISDLRPLAQRLAVYFRGWDFPHVDPNSSPLIGDRWVGEVADWEGIKEVWRFYQSGQFIYYGGFLLDWPGLVASRRKRSPIEDNGPALAVEEIVDRLFEVFEFAARLALSPAGGLREVVSVDAVGLEGRHLCSWSGTPLDLRGVLLGHLPSFSQHHVFTRDELLGNSDQIALHWSRELARRFGWEPAEVVLEGFATKARGTRGGHRV